MSHLTSRNKAHQPKGRVGRSIGKLAALGILAVAGATAATGCLERPVVPLQPNLSNLYVDQVTINAIDKIDLLFVADNSVSMADKQKLFQAAVPQMVKRLVRPDCVKRDDTNVVDESSRVAPGANGECPAGLAQEFKPINDINIAVISSSLGANGVTAANTCGDPTLPQKDDKARPMPKVRTGLDGSPFLNAAGGFLHWDGTQDPDAFSAEFGKHIAAAGEIGCGYEATNEAWYRFLVDPQPPASVSLSTDGKTLSVPEGVDSELLSFREQFLRPDSLVAIVVLSDENDCSIMSGGSYYARSGGGARLFGYGSGSLTNATSVCDTNPNDKCCLSCMVKGTSAVPSECAGELDSACAVPALPPEEDRLNTRCFQNKKRFGIDLLYPAQRYIDGLSKLSIANWREAPGSATVPNPLLMGTNGQKPRGQGLVFFAGVIGVPWQDIATPETLGDPAKLKYLKARDLSAPVANKDFDRWAVMLGSPNHAMDSRYCADNPSDQSCGAAPVLPRDPFMVESIDARAAGQAHPIVETVSTTANPDWNEINGHEYDNEFFTQDFLGNSPAHDDLQYACIFPLAADAVIEEADCSDVATDQRCDCLTEPDKQRPLCQGNPSTGTATNRQTWGKAYPGLRFLEVLRGFGDNSIVSSICPKVQTGDQSSPHFGYNPAVSAIVDRLADVLGGTCLPRQVSYDPDTKKVPCTVVEARALELGELSCATPGRAEPNAALKTAVLRQAEATQLCSGAGCDTYQICEITQLVAGEANGDACLNTDPYPSAGSPGYCYIDPAQGTGSETLVASCPANQKRKLRFVGDNTPANNTTIFVACLGDAGITEVPTTP